MLPVPDGGLSNADLGGNFNLQQALLKPFFSDVLSESPGFYNDVKNRST